MKRQAESASSLPDDFPAFRTAFTRRLTPHAIQICWSFFPTSYDLSDIVCEIFRSQSFSGPWELLGQAEEGAFHFYDRNTISPGIMYSRAYRVRVASISGRGYRDSDVIVPASHAPDHIAMEMMRKKRVFLRARAGIRAALLIRKKWGPKCSRCFDPVRRLASDPNCPACYGVGISGGFLRPVHIYALLNPDQEIMFRSPTPHIDGSTTCEIATDAFVDPEDVLVDCVLNIRYSIRSVRQLTHRGALVTQILSLVRLDESDIVYKYPVHDDEVEYNRYVTNEHRFGSPYEA